MADTPLCTLDRDFLLDHLRQQRGETASQTKSETHSPLVLDLGCGTGRLAFPASELGFEVVGVDLSQHMLEELAARSEREPQACVVPVRASLVELDCFADGIADHAFCMFSTLGMIAGEANRLRFLRHVHRILRDGGTFVFHVHRRWAALTEPGGAKQLLQSWLRSRRSPTDDFGDWTYAYRGLPDMFMHRFDTRELRRLITASGLKLQRIDRINLTGTATTHSPFQTGGYFLTTQKVSGTFLEE
ncbi:class I SAM-dependent methyltransferase [Rhodopirellula sp. MGV]|uniref:class I SAM-dependent methyltransferase n=1 Tax=Rhodopirellula sp. MGV TaxID=2023130 RepID=UPI0013040A17|nr:class I SAM-dependent methyltransferase [Rhodopirellula sp. MGV]